MATVATRKGRRGKLREVQFTFRGRQAVRLGRATAKQAATVRLHIESLIAQAMTGHPADAKTQAWVRSLPDTMHERIARTGLCESRGSSAVEAWIDRCIKTKSATDASSTTTRRKQAKRFLLEYFEAGRDLRAITTGDAEDFEAFLHNKGLAEATVRKRLADARQWFGMAVKHKLIEVNPFADIRVAVPATKNHVYISNDDAVAVMEGLPNARLRLIFALARWGGLRTPSEPAALQWSDIDWSRNRIRVTDVKRKRTRDVPMFPELVEPLREWFEAAPAGSIYVFPGMSKNSSALWKSLHRAIKSASLEPWARLWQNLRSSRQTELEEHYPTHVVCAWLGNSAKVAAKHYLQVRETDYESAVKGAAESVGMGRNRQAKPPANAV